jgi:hypothetical protein
MNGTRHLAAARAADLPLPMPPLMPLLVLPNRIAAGDLEAMQLEENRNLGAGQLGRRGTWRPGGQPAGGAPVQLEAGRCSWRRGDAAGGGAAGGSWRRSS